MHFGTTRNVYHRADKYFAGTHLLSAYATIAATPSGDSCRAQSWDNRGSSCTWKNGQFSWSIHHIMSVPPTSWPWSSWPARCCRIGLRTGLQSRRTACREWFGIGAECWSHRRLWGESGWGCAFCLKSLKCRSRTLDFRLSSNVGDWNQPAYYVSWGHSVIVLYESRSASLSTAAGAPRFRFRGLRMESNRIESDLGASKHTYIHMFVCAEPD